MVGKLVIKDKGHINESTLKHLVIAGIGLVGKRHAEVIRQHPQARLIAIVDPSDEAQKIARSFDFAMLSHA